MWELYFYFNDFLYFFKFFFSIRKKPEDPMYFIPKIIIYSKGTFNICVNLTHNIVLEYSGKIIF